MTGEQNDQAWLKNTKERHAATAAAFGIVCVHNIDDFLQRTQAGRCWQRMHLWGTTKGLGMHPLSQMTERAGREKQLNIEPKFINILKELIGEPGYEAAIPFRIGWPTLEALASPRRSVEQVLIK
jgi:hypothetical protein